MILILGKGDLATAINQLLPTAVCVGRPEYDFSRQEDCNRLLNDFQPNTVINTAALNEDQDPWQVLTVNYVSATYLTIGFYDRMNKGNIINVSSATTLWVSYPEIKTGRLVYNISKESLSSFGRHFNRKIIDNTKDVYVSTVEIGRFASKFNNYKPGMDILKAAGHIVSLIDNPVQQITIAK